MNIFQKILTYKKSTSTYAVGLVQAKAYRTLKQKTNAFLAPHGLTASEWALLGLLFETPEGHTLTDISVALGVKGPLVTRMVAILVTKNVVAIKKTDSDSRMKRLVLTAIGRNLVARLEPLLRKESATWVRGATTRDLISYLRVLHIIVKNE